MRIHQIDALRGFALFGILMVNIFVFHAPYSHYGPFYGAFEGMQKAIVDHMVYFFGGKFMFIYAFLFGYSFWIQYEKWSDQALFQSYWNKRMGLLAVFGIFHILLLSFGDILLPYAILGLTLPYFANKSNLTIIAWFFLIYLIPVYEFILRGIFEYPPIFIQPCATLEEYIRINGQGSWIEIFQLRIQDYFSFGNEKLIMYIPKELALFLLGMLAGRNGLATQLSARKGAAFCLFAFTSLLTMYLFRSEIIGLFNYKESIFQRTILGLIIHFAEFFHGMLYIIGFFLLWKWKPIQQILFPLTYTGRLSLTNYLGQSLICAILFSGLGYYGQLTPLQLVYCVFAIYLAQLVFSVLWLQKYTNGPMEYLWRKYSK